MGNSGSTLFESPWRKVDWQSKAKLVDEVNKFPEYAKTNYDVRILLHGPVGAGKSSFINSVSSALRGRMVHDAAVANNAGVKLVACGCILTASTGHPPPTQTHKIQKGKPRSFYPFVFNDLMGLEGVEGIRTDDIISTMKGHVMDGYTFNPVQELQSDDQRYKEKPTPDDKTHVLVCVIPAHGVSVLSPGVVDKIKNIRLKASSLGIPQICVITKIDEAHPLMVKDIKNVYRMKIVKQKMEEFSAKVGIPMIDIFPVKNYHEETDLDDDMDVLLLKALQHMIQLGEDFICKHYD